METLAYNFLSFLSGFVFGSLNWYFMYSLFNMVLVVSNKSKISRTDKIKLTLVFLVKVLLLFGGCYLLIAVLKLGLVWFVIGVTLSLAGAIFVLYKKVL